MNEKIAELLKLVQEKGVDNVYKGLYESDENFRAFVEEHKNDSEEELLQMIQEGA